MKTLYLPLKAKWFNQILDGTKPFEYRLKNAYWKKRLEGRHYDRIQFSLGYPKKTDTARHIVYPYRGYEVQTIISEEWGDDPQEVYAIYTPNT